MEYIRTCNLLLNFETRGNETASTVLMAGAPLGLSVCIKSIILNTKFIIFNTKFIDFDENRYRSRAPDGFGP